MTAPAEVVERRSVFSGFVVVTSTIVTVATTIELEGLNAGKPHCFVGAQFFSDAGGVTPVLPSAGAIAVTIRTINNTPNFEAPPVATIDATAPTTIDWSANTLSVRGIPTGILGATHYRFIATCNET